jgi:hypothetical protein
MDSKELEVSEPSLSDDGNSISGTTVTGDAFTVSVQMQIQSLGLHIDNFGHSDSSPIPVFGVSADGSSSASPEFVSIRPSPKSNSCALLDSTQPQQTALISTVYRWGPGRNPRMRVLPAGNSFTPEQAVEGEFKGGEEWEVTGTGNPLSRTKRMVTPYGMFEWRYGSRSEKKEQYKATSLLVLDKVDGPKSKHRTRVAQLVRNDEFRTPGTTNWNTNGNGGRLQMDARLWEDESKAGARDLQAFVVASCICMLKKEVDRQRNNQVALVT